MGNDEAKLLSTYSFRIPPHVKAQLDTIPADLKRALNKRLRIEVARIIHESRFDPHAYLGNVEDDQ